MILKTMLTAAAVAVLSAAPAFAKFPDRPVSMIVPWSAGGGTDAIARMLANGLEKELGQPINVINRTGGAGVIGHTEIANAAPDGYTIGLITAEIATYYSAGLADLTHKNYTPIALINLDAGTFTVNANGNWKDLKAALEDIKQSPAGTFKLASAPGAGYHLAFAGLLSKAGIDPNKVTIVPNAGAAPSFQELASGGVDVVPYALPEGKPMIDAGIAKPLAVFSAERNKAFPDVPTAAEVSGVEQVGGTWRAIVAPAGIPADEAKALEAAVKKAWNDAAFQEFMTSRGFGLTWQGSAGLAQFLATQEQENGTVMKEIGLAKR